MYTEATELGIQYVTRPWDDQQKHIVGGYHRLWKSLWNMLLLTLSKAGYSSELIDTFNRHNFTFFLRMPQSHLSADLCVGRESYSIRNITPPLEKVFNAIGNYMVRCTGSRRQDFEIAIDFGWKPFDGLRQSIDMEQPLCLNDRFFRELEQRRHSWQIHPGRLD